MKLEKLYETGRRNQDDCDEFLNHYYTIMESKMENVDPNADEDETEEKMVIIAEILNNLYRDNNGISFIEFDLLCNSALDGIIRTFDSNYVKEDDADENDKIGMAVQESVNYYLSQLEGSLSL